jgi:hypothetical protein
VSNLEIFGQALPWGGGGYFRLLPQRLHSWGVSRILRGKKIYLFYCHPWEIDPEQPKAKQIGFLERFRHYVNLDKTLTRLEHFLTSFQGNNFISCQNYLECQEQVRTREEHKVGSLTPNETRNSLNDHREVFQ